MEKAEENKSNDQFLNVASFTQKEFENLYNCVIKGAKEYDRIKLEYLKKGETKLLIVVLAYKNESWEKFQFYKTPASLSIENKLYKIYTVEQCFSVISQFNLEQYSITINDKEIKNKHFELESLKKISIKKIKSEIKEEEFSQYIIRIKPSFPLKNSIISLEKKKLSFYFNDICISSDTNTEFVDFILEGNRIEFINKIDDFLKSKNLFYLVLGTDGIGKTITLLYYTSSLLNDYGNLYFNLKLFLKNETDKIKIKEIFFNELKRIFLTDNNIGSVKSFTMKKYNNLINNINDSILESEGINYFWELLFMFIKIYDKSLIGNIFIVLDQYKIDKIDNEFKNLNKLCELINSKELINHFKLMILISINNYDTKDIFLENLNYLPYFPIKSDNLIPLPNYKSNDIGNFRSKNNKDNNNNYNERNNYEFEDIEKFLNEKHKEFQINFNNSAKEIQNNSFFISHQIFSKLELNSKYYEITKKEYLNEIVNCKNLIDNKMHINYKNCIKLFGYSLKYFSLLLKEINNTEKEEDETDDDFSRRVIKNFYAKMGTKIIYNLDSYYISFYKNDKDFLIKKIENLKTLNDSIYEENVYPLKDMNNLIKLFPIKYLNIYIVGLESNFIPLDKIDLSKYGFFFDYSNAFIRETVNKYYLKEASAYGRAIELGGSGFGAAFENYINKKISTLFDNKIVKRNVFTIIGTFTKSYINKLREEENLEFYNFYDLKTLTDVEIDGVDIIKVTKDILDITNCDIFLNQLSKTGKSFDAGILKKLPPSSEINSPTHDLILIQDTKKKIMQLKDKDTYCKDAGKSKDFLQNVYDNLKINKIYLIFVIPYGLNNLETINKLNENQFYYIFYNPEKNVFLNKDNKVIENFCIPEAEIQFNAEDFDFLNALTNINISKKILKFSARNYLGIKRLHDNKFIDIYDKFSHDNAFNCITLTIPIELKNNIIDILYKEQIFLEEKSINFVPSINCKLEEIKRIFAQEKIMFIFSYENSIYLFYYNYYKILDDFQVIKCDFNGRKNFNIIRPNNNLNSFFDIKNYQSFCFGFNVIKNYLLD
jgi:hypothetical protein